MRTKNTLQSLLGCAVAAFLALVLPGPAAADGVRSLMPKKAIPFQKSIYTPPEFSLLPLGDILSLVKKADSGNPLAQHELGLRYLIGKQFSPDTAKAAYWIGKAADHNLISAHYNMGIMLNQGWGLPWNPFKAYKHFQYAALHGMMEARYVYALMLAENLVVARNDSEAYRWLAMSADSGYAPAREVLAEFYRRAIEAGQSVTADGNRASRGKSVSAADGQDADPDSSAGAAGRSNDAELLKETLIELRSDDSNHAGDAGFASDEEEDIEGMFKAVCAAAEAGSPEALALMGRWAETGTLIERNEISASVYYLRAMRNHSTRAPMMIFDLTRREGYFERLKERIAANDPAAKFVGAKLAASGLDEPLPQAQVLELLETAASCRYNEAMVELGLSYYSGRGVAADRKKAKSLFKTAADAGHREALIRLWMMELGEKEDSPPSALVDSLRRASSDGSILAQTMMGYCCQKGSGTIKNIPRAVYYYRKAAYRGSNAAYAALREMVDAIRPEDPEFQIVE